MAHRLRIMVDPRRGQPEGWWRALVMRLVDEVREECHGEFKSELVEIRLRELLSGNGARLYRSHLEFASRDALTEFVLRYCR